jgi:hypothetical protein
MAPCPRVRSQSAETLRVGTVLRTFAHHADCERREPDCCRLR